MIFTFNWSLMNKYNYIMECVNNIYIYLCICIRIMTFHTRLMTYIYIYICILELRLILAAHCRSIPCCIRFCMMFVYFYAIYMKRILSEQQDWDTFTTLIILE